MSESARFCPECGESVTVDPAERDLPEHVCRTRRRERALCDACYFERFDLVSAPDRIEVQVCGSCGAVRRGERWVDVDARDHTDVAIEEVTEALAVHVDAEDVRWGVDPEQVDPTTVRMHATFSGMVRDTSIEESVTVPVKIAQGTCTRCGRIAGDYYASTVQVRADDRDPAGEEIQRAREVAEDVVGEMEATGDRDAFITEASETDGGLDLKLSTTKIGRKIADRLVAEFGGHADASESLITEDEDGEEVYRVTYAVRLPPYRPGEVIDPGNGEGPVLVRSVQGNLKARRLATGERYEAPIEELGDATRLGTREDATETTLVAVEDDRAVQVLDPETYEAKTIARPGDLDPGADTVRVLKHREGLHVFPEE
ncbi:MAG: 60S ribosomal export protein NMD3 [Halobacteriales archaeon]